MRGMYACMALLVYVDSYKGMQLEPQIYSSAVSSIASSCFTSHSYSFQFCGFGYR